MRTPTNRAARTAAAIALAWIGLAAAPAEGHGKHKHDRDAVVLWFNSVMQLQGAPADRPVTVCVTDQVISWGRGASAGRIEVPDARVSFKPWETGASTFFGGDLWDTSAPAAQADDETFMSGVALPLPARLPKHVLPVTWSARFATDVPGVTVRWKWGAAPYSSFTDDYEGLDVAPVDKRRWDAGTPVAFRQFALIDERDDDDDHDRHHRDDDDRDDPVRFTGPRVNKMKNSAKVTIGCGGVY